MPYTINPADPNQPLDTDDRSKAAAEFRALKSYLQAQISALTALAPPVGSFLGWSGTIGSIPSGWIVVPTVATTVSRATYPALHAIYAAAGYPYGAGDGATTFGIPYIAADAVPLAANGNLGAVALATQVTAGLVTPVPAGGMRLYWILRAA